MSSDKFRFAAFAAAVVCMVGSFAADAPIRFMTYNVAYCRYLPEGESDTAKTVVDPAVAAARIRAEAPDFLALNEMSYGDGNSASYGKTCQPAKLAELTGMHWTFGKAYTASNTKNSYGVAILSKEAPLSSWTVPLPRTSPTNSDEVIGYEPRVLLICEFTNLCVATSHFDLYPAHQAAYLPTVLAALKECAKPVFFMGDWNAKPDSAVLESIKESFTVVSPTSGVRTYHGHSATGGSVIDYISVDKAHEGDFFVKSSYVVEDVVTSDHNPVIAEIYRRPAASELGWVDESFLSTGRTGTWSPSVAWDAGTWTAELCGDSVFTPAMPSGGNRVTMTVTAAFDAVPMEGATPDATAQGAVWLGTNGCFQVWTRLRQGSGGQAGWVDVEAEGVTPAPGVEYTFRFVFDYRSRTYSASVQYGAEWRPLVGSDALIAPPAGESGGMGASRPTSFPLAVPATCISRLGFSGDGLIRSIFGQWFSGGRGLAFSIK